MVSGEAVQVARKNLTATSKDPWDVPGLLAGNQVPGWVDNAGSITRRIVLFDFRKKVVVGDMMLGKVRTAHYFLGLLHEPDRAGLVLGRPGG